MTDANHDQAQQFLRLTEEERIIKLGSMRKIPMAILLQNVARLVDKPGAVTDLHNQLRQTVRHLEAEVSQWQQSSAFNLELCSEAQRKLDALKQDFEDERARLLERSGEMEDDWNRLKNENEQNKKVIIALIHARNAHVASAIVAKAAALADMEVTGLGVDFIIEDVE